MIKIENAEVFGWEAAIRGMRNPLNSWSKSDSGYGCQDEDDEGKTITYHCKRCNDPCRMKADFLIGANDLELMMKLCNAGTDHRKFMRMINVTCDITAPMYWWSEYDTYKVGTVRNSCSKMHTVHVKPFSKDNFSHEGCDLIPAASDALDHVVNVCEHLRKLFNDTQDKKYWRALIELLPEGFNMRSTVQLNYEVLVNMYHSRKAHKLDEWREFCKWVETLPYSELITGNKSGRERVNLND